MRFCLPKVLESFPPYGYLIFLIFTTASKWSQSFKVEFSLSFCKMLHIFNNFFNALIFLAALRRLTHKRIVVAYVGFAHACFALEKPSGNSMARFD